MVYDHFYHKIIQPMAIVRIVDILDKEIYKGIACYITDFKWNRIKNKQIITAFEDFTSNEMYIKIDMDYFADLTTPPKKM